MARYEFPRVFLAEYLKRTEGQAAFDAAAFEAVVALLAALVGRDPSSTMVAVVDLLPDVRCDIDPVEVAQGVLLRARSDEERAKFERNRRPPNLLIFGEPQPSLAVVEIRPPRRSLAGLTSWHEFHLHAAQSAWVTLLALRLAGAGHIHAGPVRLLWANPFVFRSPGMREVGRDRPRPALAEPYAITAEVAARVRELWPHVKRARNNPELTLAFARLNDAYERSNYEDKLIDLWIALESLFLPPSERMPEMAKSMGLAVSYYLGEDAKRRRSIQELVTASHRARSDIVHGKYGHDRDPRGKEAQALKLTVDKTEELLRRALGKMIREGASPSA